MNYLYHTKWAYYSSNLCLSNVFSALISTLILGQVRLSCLTICNTFVIISIEVSNSPKLYLACARHLFATKYNKRLFSGSVI